MDKIDLVVRDRSNLLFEGQVDSVSSTNDIGDFDILPYHSNFVTTIKDKIIVKMSDRVQKMDMERGIVKVTENKVEVYVGI